MTHPLTLDHVISQLAERTRERLAWQITDPAQPDAGAVISPSLGIAEPASGISTIAACGFLFLAGQHNDKTVDWLAHAHQGLDYVLREQRDNGRIDLVTCNYDSAPDTAFAVQRLLVLLELSQESKVMDSNWLALQDKIRLFVRRAVPGIGSGGFHTPNHRWVMASALAYAKALLPDLDVREAVQAYLDEGFDLDPDGAFTERSIGVYDAVCTRSLLFLAEHMGLDNAQHAAQANLEFNLYLLHPDGTAETGLSRRQDYGKRMVPISLAANYVYCAYRNPALATRFVPAAQMLWEKATDPKLDDLNWLCYALMKTGDPASVQGRLLDPYTRHLAHNGLWRVRKGSQSATVFTGTTRLFTMCYEQAELAAIKISQSYFGCGRFTGDHLEVTGQQATLISTGTHKPHRPGYALPLSRAVPVGEWSAANEARDYRMLPPAQGRLTVQAQEHGFDFIYETNHNFDGVTTQIAFDFTPGGIWETDDTCTSTSPGQTIFLKQGYGTMRYGTAAIHIGPGADAHRMWKMRDSEAAPGHVRVLMTFCTPVSHHFSVTCTQEPLSR